MSTESKLITHSKIRGLYLIHDVFSQNDENVVV